MHPQGKLFLLNASSRVYRILGLQNAAIHILHTIFSYDWEGLSRLHIHAMAVRWHGVSPCGLIILTLWPPHGFPENRVLTLLFTIIVNQKIPWKNLSCLPFPGFEPGTSSCGTRKCHFVHNCTFHCLHLQRKTFLLNDSSRVHKILGLLTTAIHIVHVLFFYNWVGLYILHNHSLAVS